MERVEEFRRILTTSGYTVTTQEDGAHFWYVFSDGERVVYRHQVGKVDIQIVNPLFLMANICFCLGRATANDPLHEGRPS